MTLPEKLLHYRKEAGLSQLELAERLDVSRQAVSRWESGAAVPSTENLKFLSGLYGVSVDFLLDDGAEPGEAEKGEQRSDGKANSLQASLILKKRVMVMILAALIIGIGIGVAITTWREGHTGDIPFTGELEQSYTGDIAGDSFSLEW